MVANLMISPLSLDPWISKVKTINKYLFKYVN